MRTTKATALLIACTFVALSVSAFAQANRPSPPGEANVSFADGKKVTINYSRPSMRGRKIFDELVPYGQPWRAGANEATALNTDADLMIGDLKVPKGSYTLFALPTQDKWTLIVSKKTGEWGIPYPGESSDLGRTAMKVSKTASPVEQFTIALDKSGAKAATLKLTWENTEASVNITEQ